MKRRDLLCFVNVDIVASYQWTKMVSIFVWLMGIDPSDSAEWCSSRSITSSWGDRIDEVKEKWRNG